MFINQLAKLKTELKNKIELKIIKDIKLSEQNFQQNLNLNNC